MASTRLDKLKKARSLNDVMAIVDDISEDIKQASGLISKLTSSLSAELVINTSKRPTAKVAPSKVRVSISPDIKELRKHNEVIDRLYNNAVELDSAESLVKQAFVGNKKQKAALAAIAALKEEVDTSLNDAFDSLDAIAQKHIPKKAQSLADSLTTHLINTLRSTSYKNIFRQTFVTVNKTNGWIEFSQYIGLERLKGKSGFIFDQYFFVLTSVVTKTGLMRSYLNSFPDFKVPGKYPLGKEVETTKDVYTHMRMLLAHNEFQVEHDKLPMPFEGDFAENTGMSSIRGVDSVKVNEDSLVVTLNSSVKTPAAIQRIVIEIQARLGSILGSGHGKAFTYSQKTSGGRKVLTFILINAKGSKKRNMNLAKLAEVSEVLGLNDAQQKALRFALQN
jgi:hypothetical protein